MRTLISALKRNDRVTVVAEVLEIMGQPERAEEARKATRATVAFFDRSFAGLEEAPLDESNVDEHTELDEQADLGDVVGPCDLTYADDSVVDHSFEEIRELIAKGKGKKALKLIKAAKEAGARGSVIKDLKKQAKEL